MIAPPHALHKELLKIKTDLPSDLLYRRHIETNNLSFDPTCIPSNLNNRNIF